MRNEVIKLALLKITLKSDLCAGGGASTGIAVDTDICVDKYGLPYIPARRIKGCLRSAAETLAKYQSEGSGECAEAVNENIVSLFGDNRGTEGCLRICDAHLPGAVSMRTRLEEIRSLSDQENEYALALEAKPLNVANLFTSVRGQTRLKDGIAQDNTLRYTRVLHHYNPFAENTELVLEAPVQWNRTDNMNTLMTLLKNCCSASRYLGTMKHRGLGRIKIEYCGAENVPLGIPDYPVFHMGKKNADEIVFNYTVAFDEPVTMIGCGEQLLEIPARSVIGCMVAAYLSDGWNAKSAKPEQSIEFQDLFLNGAVRWSSLTPVVRVFSEEKKENIPVRTVPAPLMLIELKNAGRYENLYFASVDDLINDKTKTVAGEYAASYDGRYRIASVQSHAVYHKGKGRDGLYVQESLDAGMVYGGYVSIRRDEASGRVEELAEKVYSLLRKTTFSFGRSKNAQYSVCHLNSLESMEVHEKDISRSVETASSVIVVLQSDLVLCKDGIYVTDNASVRGALAKQLKLNATPLDGWKDYCQYHTIGGYQATWQMQKPQIPAVRAGSVYVFAPGQTPLPTTITLGEFRQEGLGVCRVFTDLELRGDGSKPDVKKVHVDEFKANRSDGEFRKNDMDYRCSLDKALLIAAVRRTLRSSVRNYYDSEYASLRRGLLGRLRLMLSDSKNYSDFQLRVKSIRPDNTNAVNQMDTAKRAENLCDAIYGTEGLFPILKDEKGFTLGTLRTDNEKLNHILSNNEDCVEAAKKELVERFWKEPLQDLLHMAYYEAEEG